MEKKNLNFQANSNRKRDESKFKGKADEKPIEEAAERLAELFYEQCLFEINLKRKKAPEQQNNSRGVDLTVNWAIIVSVRGGDKR